MSRYKSDVSLSSPTLRFTSFDVIKLTVIVAKLRATKWGFSLHPETEHRSVFCYTQFSSRDSERVAPSERLVSHEQCPATPANPVRAKILNHGRSHPFVEVRLPLSFSLERAQPVGLLGMPRIEHSPPGG